MATYTVVMIRHGESEWNKENKFCGWFDADLSEKGKLLFVVVVHESNYFLSKGSCLHTLYSRNLL